VKDCRGTPVVGPSMMALTDGRRVREDDQAV
jgi:hypothetical protein